jgi:hypothetical protein
MNQLLYGDRRAADTAATAQLRGIPGMIDNPHYTGTRRFASHHIASHRIASHSTADNNVA